VRIHALPTPERAADRLDVRRSRDVGTGD